MMSNCITLQKKEDALVSLISGMGNALVAFSGGCDSSLLAAAAYRALVDAAAAVTVRSPLTPEPDRIDAEQVARGIGIKHFCIDVDELTEPDFIAGGPRRCYYCKKLRLRVIADFAARNGYTRVLDGSNADDLLDYRPGMDAMKEFPIVSSPLLECGFTKDDVRALSREWGLSTWNKPAAACLASRVAPPNRIEKRALEQIDEAESFLRGILPPNSQVRVRHHGELARIEAESVGFKVLIARSREVVAALRTIGFRYVTLDLGGYEMGSLNPKSLRTTQ